MKLSNSQIKAIITAVCTLITTIAAILLGSCTLSLSVAKNNNNATQKTEQTSTSSVDSTYIHLAK